MTVNALDVFISYSRQDDAFKEKLARHLNVLKREGKINTWQDRDIEAGTEWAKEIKARLEKAQVILLLVTSDFLASDYCYETQMQRAIQRHYEGTARIIPIILKPCGWQYSEFKDLRALPTDNKPVTRWEDPEDAWFDIEEGIRRVVNSLDGEHQQKAERLQKQASMSGLSLVQSEEEDQRLENQFQDLDIARVQELIEILQPKFQQHSDTIQQAYRYALPRRQIFAENPHKLPLSQLIFNLKLLANGEKTYTPICKFIGYLLLDQHLEIGLKEHLRIWIRGKVEDLSPLLAQIEQEKQNLREQGNPCLLVAVSKREARYVTEAWIINHPEEYNSNQSVSGCHQIKIDDQAEWLTDQTLKNMPTLLRRFRDVCVEQFCERTIRQIHIFLPSELISHSVDSWKSDEDERDELSTTLGEYYEVVVRYSERLRERTEAVLRWREKGRSMKQRLNQPATKVFLSGDNVKPKSLLTQLKKDNAIAVKFTSTARQKELGSLLLKTGIPLAIWIRNTISNVDCPTVLDGLLGECPMLRELPTRVTSTRLEAFEYEEPDKHVGRHLVLLWDDPDLVPPKQLLSQKNL